MTHGMAEGACGLGEVEEEALSLVKPSPREEKEAARRAQEALEAAEAALRGAGYSGYTLSIEGSFAKGTWLRGELDIDIFALFDPHVCLGAVKGFAERVTRVLREMGYRVALRYAQHPYVRFLVRDVWAELVPACRVSDPSRILTPVDRTPFHREYVNRVLDDRQKDEVRLLKSFMKGVGVYGAETAVEGFSGYMAELLIAHYGCFRRLIASASKWKPPVCLDGCRDDSQAKAMYMPDPVDPRRNAAAAVSKRSLSTFILASKLYQDRHCLYYFHAAQPPPPETSPWMWGSRLSNIALLLVQPGGEVAPDTLWGIVKRLEKAIRNQLRTYGFRVLYTSPAVEETGASATRGAVYIEVEENPLPGYMLAKGPPAWGPGGRVAGFLAAHGGIVTEEGLLAARRPRRIRRLDEALGRILPALTPSSLHRIGGRVSLLYGLRAAEEASRIGGRWAWEAVATQHYWIHLVAEKCGQR